jgi:hypothetical protein
MLSPRECHDCTLNDSLCSRCQLVCIVDDEGLDSTDCTVNVTSNWHGLHTEFAPEALTRVKTRTITRGK